MWLLSTYSDEPNAVPVAFKDVTDDGKLVVGDVFLETTISNIRENGKIAISACNERTMEGYQVKGNHHSLFSFFAELLIFLAAAARAGIISTAAVWNLH
ncbi:pyridoxamine 5'-phosphate oxidase family protein [Desulfosporosinus meridiei]|uniref:Pyridoxamine 5''-phosphate oxidase n=1 Tax=Desulfosporosinus meridiei (strain ATCC BAA-275 / DSM 13257 / KCTC 12902 / NCIMB 13706 / S10) TaxID=768704 RepID=J7IR01_DESMD|nr:pyridoxamine 5'-phosphate oxidase family protein [Desulfosporosinus meridiei]AFQ44277.1 Pyridoxamine 5''-phosphate oxidase [Desulfosporosinus meridiei DSM 13257]